MRCLPELDTLLRELLRRLLCAARSTSAMGLLKKILHCPQAIDQFRADKVIA